MIQVEFLGPIGVGSRQIQASTLEELSDILKQDATIRPWLDKCAVALNDTVIKDKKTKIKSGDRVCLLPPVCGG